MPTSRFRRVTRTTICILAALSLSMLFVTEARADIQDEAWLSSSIDRLIARLKSIPELKYGATELLSAKATGTLDNYLEVYGVASDQNQRANFAASAARAFLKVHDLDKAKAWYTTALQYEYQSNALFTAAEEVNMGSLDASYRATKIIYDSARAAAKALAPVACGVPCVRAVDTMFDVTDFAIDASEGGFSKDALVGAAKKLIVEKIVSQILEDQGIKDYIQNKVDSRVIDLGMNEKFAALIRTVVSKPEYRLTVLDVLASTLGTQAVSALEGGISKTITAVADAVSNYGSPTIRVPSNPDCKKSVPDSRWKAEFYDNASLTGEPLAIRDDGEGFVVFDWGVGRPAEGCGLPADGFSARWSRTLYLPGGTYRFRVSSDDGMRVSLDGAALHESWVDQAASEVTKDVAVTSGQHTIRVEYYENGGQASVAVRWDLLSGQSQGSAPVIKSVNPGSPVSGPLDQTVTVYGTGFLSDVRLTAYDPDGQPHLLQGSQIFGVSDSSLRVRITLGAAGKWRFRAQNGSSGAPSNLLSFDVVARPRPRVSSIAPSAPAVSSRIRI